MEIPEVRFCTVVAGASCLLGVGWKSAFAELFVFALAGPTAPTGVERRSVGSLGPRSGKADELGLEIELGLRLNRGLGAEFLTAVSLLQIVSTWERSK